MKKPSQNFTADLPEKRKERGSSSIMTMIYLVLFVGGGALLFFSGLRPTWNLLSSTGWQKTTCQIISSGLETRTSTDSKTRKTTQYQIPIIVYAYTFNGNGYQSSRYNFWELVASDADRSMIQSHPAGAQGSCLVNPANPSEAVFQPMMPLGMIFLLFFGIGMVLAGGSGLIYDFRSYLLTTGWWRSTRKLKRKSATPVHTNQIVLQSKGKSKKGFFYFLVAATTIWDSFSLLFLLIFLRQLGSGSTDFLSIFFPVLVGVLLTWITIRKYLTFFEPQPVLTIHAFAVRLEEPFDLEWKFSGRSKLVTDVQIFLEAYEVDNRPNEKPAEGKSAYQTKDRAQTSLQVVNDWSNQQGKTTATIPADNQPTMKDEDKEYIWMFRVTWGTQKKSDNQRKFSFTVLPHFAVTPPPVMESGIGN